MYPDGEAPSQKIVDKWREFSEFRMFNAEPCSGMTV